MVGDAVSDITAAPLAGALRAAVRDTWGDELPTRVAVIGLGRFGGHELGYGSDADVLFVHGPQRVPTNTRPPAPRARWPM